MLGRLFNAPPSCQPVGTATVGSSEAIMLALLAHKWRWRARRQAAGEPHARPNVVMSACVHTCWEKAARYFDLEARVVPVQPGRYELGAEQVEPLVDENTIAVGAILGNTFTGGIDRVAEIDTLLRRLRDARGWDVPIHVDAASGGFVAPFAAPELEWDFRLERVKSINVSNHKFGLVYPGMGSVVFADQDLVPEELVFHITYLGGDAPTYSLNFSQPSVGVVAQYYNFLRLGRAGYARVMGNVTYNARALQRRLAALDAFEFLNGDSFMPVLALRLTGHPDANVFALSDRLRERGWIVPAYALPANAQDIAVLRLVVRESFSADMLELLGDDMASALAALAGRRPPPDASERPSGLRRPIC
jgi:glutamate decarboxylase